MNHNWLLNLNDTTNLYYLDYKTHNGPFCTKCRKFFCMLCDDITLLSCDTDTETITEWSPIGGELSNSIINKKVHNE